MKTVIFSLLFVICFTANAAQWVVDDQPADTIEMGGDNMPYGKGIYFVKSGGFPNPDNCATNTFVHFSEEFLIKNVLAIALYAQAMGKKMQFYISGCKGNYIHGHAFMLIP